MTSRAVRRGPSCVMGCLELRSFSEPRITDPEVSKAKHERGRREAGHMQTRAEKVQWRRRAAGAVED